ncbi:MAG: SAM-dependent methyltransferase [Ruminococcaceae bacterium]|nr:SAM-dependent methyltransferase [Oscillospiraceae bacterium]
MDNVKANSPIQHICELILFASEKEKLKKVVLSKSRNTSIKKAVISTKISSCKSFLQVEYFHTDNKVTHKNIDIDVNSLSVLMNLSCDFSQINLLTADGECEYKKSSSGKEIVLGADKLQKKLEQNPDNTIIPDSANRKKKYILDGSEDFLIHLDVSDKNGRVYDKRQAKFRQINRFLELVRDVEDKLPDGEIRICDLCCGKSYLSFAVYHYFANIKGFKVSMTGVDLKPDVVERCNKTARELNFEGLEFICMNVNDYEPAVLPSLVISLHACDIATDFVLNKAAEWKTDVILSTPCCHHELNHSIDSPALSFITDYSMLRQKLCDAATDALRLCRLEAEGYTTVALELIDPDETPKNIMLRAIRKKNFDKNSKEAKLAAQKYLDAKKFLCGENFSRELHF